MMISWLVVSLVPKSRSGCRIDILSVAYRIKWRAKPSMCCLLESEWARERSRPHCVLRQTSGLEYVTPPGSLCWAVIGRSRSIPTVPPVWNTSSSSRVWCWTLIGYFQDPYHQYGYSKNGYIVAIMFAVARLCISFCRAKLKKKLKKM